MDNKRAYLDFNASAPLVEEARSAMLAVMEQPGNASSVHTEGRAKRAKMDAARRQVAELCGASADRVIFTSGASEAAATLLTPDYRMGRSPLKIGKLFVAASDHPCILEGGRFATENIVKITVDGNGLIDVGDLRRLLVEHGSDRGAPLVACHHANNESGVIQPAEEIARVAKEAGGIFVLDSVQAAGRLPVDIEAIGADFVILSSHKIGGPQGAGAIVAASDLLMPVPLIRGGGQERGLRAGTENVAAIAGFGAATRVAMQRLGDVAKLDGMRGRFSAAIREHFPEVVFIAEDAPRIANTILFAIPGLKAETAQIAFDLAGIALSTGSACSSGRVGDSHVLKAMGMGDLGNAIRLSIGYETGEEELSIFESALAQIASRRSERSEAA